MSERPFNLPDGWTHEYAPVSNVVYLIAPNKGGIISVNFDHRKYALGYSYGYVFDGPPVPLRGRGWREKLVLSAVAHLAAILATSTAPR